MKDQKALRDYLQDALIQGRLRNPSYSLRALAQKAGLSPSALSEILSGKRRVTEERAQKILTKLGASPDHSDTILQSFSQTPIDQPQQQLSIDQFYLIAEWYHFAILSLAETEDFKENPQWISKRLNLPIPQITKALERMERLGALTRDRKGHLRASGIQLSTPDEIAHRGLRQQHAEVLDLCRHSLEQHSISERDFLGVTMTLDPADIPLAKKLLRRFVGKFCNRLEQGRKKEVYRLNLQFIPLTDVKEGKKK
ncbi:MAG TPA: TIGR02147 family protein [Pseudobdellovibrionaceae bacterium]|jgi:uncharacterized protein (TIGR02147 family)